MQTAKKVEYFNPVKVEPEKSLDNYFEILQNGTKTDFKFDQIKFKAERIGEQKKAVQAAVKTVAQIQAQGSKLSETWYLQKKSRFSMNQTWINCFINFIIPSDEAINIVTKVDPKSKTVENLKDIEAFLVSKLGKDFHKKYQTFTDPKSQAKEIQEVMHVFQFIFEMMIGQEDIQRNHVTERLLLNKTMDIKYDFINVQKGKDAKKYFTMSMEQYKVKEEKESYADMARKAAGKGKVVDPVYYQLDRGNKDLQDVVQISHTLGQFKDKGKNEKKFDTWYKKLTDIRSKEILKDSKEGINHLKKLNHLKSIVEGILRDRTDNQPAPDNNMLDKMNDQIDIKDNIN